MELKHSGPCERADAGDEDDGDSDDDPRKDTLKVFAEYLEKPAPFTVLVFEAPSSITASVSTKYWRRRR